MKNKKGSSLLETRRRNRVFIKDTIFRMEPITRTEIAEELGLTLPTITTSVNTMLKEGILEEIPSAESRSFNNMGRRPLVVSFKADAAYAIGIELGPYATRAVLLNMKGEVLRNSEYAAADSTYGVMLSGITEQIREMIPPADSEKLLGVGIGLPGFIECDKGIIRSNFRKDWTGRHLAEDLEKELKLPVLIDNNVRLRAVGYEMRYRGHRPDSFAYFYISKGIACPLMVKDDILSGYTAGAGEIGHTIISITDNEGNMEQRCLDDLVGERMILDKCRRLEEKGEAGILKQLIDASGRFGMKQVLEAQLKKEKNVCRVLEETIEYLGIALANVVNFINPGFVVVDGYIMKNEENRTLLKDAAVSKFFGLNEEEVKLVFEPFDHYCGAKGAAYFIIRRLFLEK